MWKVYNIATPAWETQQRLWLLHLHGRIKSMRNTAVRNEHASLGKARGSMLTKDIAAMMHSVIKEHDAKAVIALSLQSSMPVVCGELVLT